jgi:hypothetical protein
VVNDGHLAEHLANDDLNVLVVDRYTLRTVDALHTIDEVQLHRANTLDAKNFLRVEVSDVQLRTERNVLAILNEEGRATQNRVSNRLVTVVRGQDEAASPIRVLDVDDTVSLCNRGSTLGGTSLEQLGDARKTLRDVICGCDTTGVDGTLCELGSRLTDGLCGYVADCLTFVY